MYTENFNLGSNKSRVDDIRWLCSLNESELDFLISLKVMILRGAKKIGSKAIAKNLDLKFLRALSFILMNKLKGHLEVMPVKRGRECFPCCSKTCLPSRSRELRAKW
ncbi:unnamed protein product [Cuscuta europaea]|uniref:Uncharacterized protein n=1 Tax=Cuscuta europaea TaxID=41803 RepID=A0A9P1E6L1_CUSEU|nr:unnamed protein product [Cuscuta europaea]